MALLEFSPVLKELLNGVHSLRPELSQPGLGWGWGGHTLFTEVLATCCHDLISVSLCSTATAAVPVLKSVFSGLGLP